MQTGRINLFFDLHKVNDSGAKDGVLDMIINMSSLGGISNTIFAFQIRRAHEGKCEGRFHINFSICCSTVGTKVLYSAIKYCNYYYI